VRCYIKCGKRREGAYSQEHAGDGTRVGDDGGERFGKDCGHVDLRHALADEIVAADDAEEQQGVEAREVVVAF
jgi:hypothetical protein